MRNLNENLIFRDENGNTFLSISCFETRTRSRKWILKVEREKIKLILTGIPGNGNSRHSLAIRQQNHEIFLYTEWPYAEHTNRNYINISCCEWVIGVQILWKISKLCRYSIWAGIEFVCSVMNISWSFKNVSFGSSKQQKLKLVLT